MKRITDIKELREIQMRIMDSIHFFCIKNNLCYSLSSGTLLGAIRHKGYIPWDDDIDIYMPRKSYEVFINSFGVQDGKFELVDYRNRDKYTQTYAKVIDNTTIAYEKGFNAPDMGVWVDVFPVDGMPEGKFLRTVLFIAKRFVSMLIQNGYKNENSKGMKYLFSRYFPIRMSSRYKLFEWITTRWPKGNDICNLSSGGPLKDSSFPVSCFEHTIEVSFEDRKWYAMNGWDTYLHRTYGDYMKLPPVEKQTHHDFEAYYK
jgi:lipopolysaccharide cholinephosphotransferase